MSAVLFGAFAALCWGVHDLIARVSSTRIGPWRMAFSVIVAGGLVLSGYFALRGFPDGTARGVGLSLLLGLSYAAGIGGLFKAFSLGPVSLVAPITATYPVLVVVWGMLWGLAPSPLQFLAIGTALFGAILVGRFGGNEAAEPLPRGRLLLILVFCLVCGVGYAVSVVIGQKAATVIGEVEAAWISRATAALVLLPFAVKEAGVPIAPWRWWPAVLAMGLLDLGGLIAVNSAGHLADKEFAAIGSSAYGAVAVILAMLVLKERVAPGQWLGIGLIVAGVAGLSGPR